MTIEEAIKILEYPVKKWSMEWDEREDGLSYYEALDMAISALRQQEHFREATKKVEPLTLDELQKMDGEAVWVEFQDGSGGCWGLVHITMFNHVVLANGLYCTFGKPYYGKNWLAYRQKLEEDGHDERKENENARR